MKHNDYFCKRAPPQTSNWILNVDLTRGVVNVGCGWNASAWNLWSQTGVQGNGWDSQTIRNLNSGDMGILLVVIQLGVTGSKKIRLLYLLDLLEGRVEKGQCDLVCVECLWVVGLIMVMLMSYSNVVSVVLVLLGVGPVLSRWEFEWQKVCCLVSGKYDVSRVTLQEFNISYWLL